MNNRWTRIEWFYPQMAGTEEQRIIAVLRSGFVNDGPVTREFEARIAELVEVRHCVAVTSGTVAIALALMAAGVEAGDEVLVPDFTFIATANAVRLVGASVRLVDVEPNRLTIDPDKLEQAIGPRTRAVVTVDVNGRGANYRVIEPICRARGIRLITDSAEALGSRYAGRPLGSFGDAGCFSFSPNKFITTGQGGMVATNDENLYRRLLELKDQGRACRGTGGDDLHPVLGFNFKFTDIQAAMGIAQLEALEKRIQRARERDFWYREALGDIAGVTFPGLGAEENGEVRVWTDILSDARDRVRSALEAAGIGCRAFWHPIHLQAPYRDETHVYPVATSVSQQGLWLPSAFNIDRRTVQRVCYEIRKVLDI